MNRPNTDTIQERVNKATKGPWLYDGMHDEIHTPEAEDGSWWLIVSESRRTPEQEHAYPDTQFNGDFDFLANARQDIPILLDYIKHLEGIRCAICGVRLFKSCLCELIDLKRERETK